MATTKPDYRKISTTTTHQGNQLEVGIVPLLSLGQQEMSLSTNNRRAENLHLPLSVGVLSSGYF